MKTQHQTKVSATPGTQEVLITRTFNAPVELLFHAHTDPVIYAKWLGPHGFSTTFQQLEPVNGGSFHFTQIDPEGGHHAFRGVYHEVIPNKSIINTFEWLNPLGSAHLQTIIFEPLSRNQTEVITRVTFRSVEERDGMVNGGMETGFQEGYQRLDEILEKHRL